MAHCRVDMLARNAGHWTRSGPFRISSMFVVFVVSIVRFQMMCFLAFVARLSSFFFGFGSLAKIGFHLLLGSLMPNGFFPLDGSLRAHGFLVTSGSLSYCGFLSECGSLWKNGFLAYCGSLSTVGFLASFGSPFFLSQFRVIV